jgi:hypothetical protein
LININVNDVDIEVKVLVSEVNHGTKYVENECPLTMEVSNQEIVCIIGFLRSKSSDEEYFKFLIIVWVS